MKKLLKVLCVFAVITVFIGGAMLISGNHHSSVDKIITYDTSNQYILDRTDISGHRSGGGIAPEETMMAFKNCAENKDFNINVFEFDLHITKDDVLVLLHDDTLDRTSNSLEVFGEEDVRPEDKTYDELRQLNMGAKFENEAGEMPYADLSGDAVSDDLKILRVEDALDYLTSVGDYKFIIEIKNGDELGKKGVDILHNVLVERNLVDKVVFGTFHKEISDYVDTSYTDMIRSTSIKEVLKFWIASIFNSKSYEPPCSVLQLPYCAPFTNLGINLGTARVINYAHSHNMAVQYWTVNDKADMEYLTSLGADCIMTDYPDELYIVELEDGLEVDEDTEVIIELDD